MGPNRKFQVTIAIIFLLIFIGILIGTAVAAPSLYGNWTRVAENVSFPSRGGFNAAVFHDKMWVIGGQTLTGASHVSSVNGISYYGGGKDVNVSEVWSSRDGKTWDLVTEDPGFSGRISPGVAVFQNRLWVIGGTGFDDVWSSSDGRKWIRETEHAGFSPRGDMGVAVFHDRLWVIAGGTNYPFFLHANMTDDVWSSPDGRTWNRETEHAGFGPRFGYGVVVYEERLWMIDGMSDTVHEHPGFISRSVGGAEDVWVSDNGANWTRVRDHLPFGRREFAPVTVFDNKLWIVGGGYRLLTTADLFEIFYGYNNVWSSIDGINWSLETEDPGFTLGAGPVLVYKNAIWDIGGPDIWSMPLQAPAAQSSPGHPPTTISQRSPIILPTTIPPHLLTVQIVPATIDVQNSSPSNLSIPVNSGLPTHAGIDSFTVCLNLLTTMIAVMIVRAMKTV